MADPRTELADWKKREIWGENWVEPVDPGEELPSIPPEGHFSWSHFQHREY